MKPLHRSALVASTMAVVLLSVGCAADGGVAPSPSAPSTSPAPIEFRFESEAELQAAAERVFSRYLAAIDKLFEDPDPSKAQQSLASLTTAANLKEDQESLRRTREDGLHSSGRSLLTYFQLQRANLRSGEARAYACLDFSDVRVLDDSGRDVTPESREELVSQIALFRVSGDRLVFAGIEAYKGSSLCDR